MFILLVWKQNISLFLFPFINLYSLLHMNELLQHNKP